MYKIKDRLQTAARSALFWVQAIVLTTVGILPMMTGSASAAQLTSRKVVIDKSAAASTNVQHSFTWTAPTSAAVRGIIFDFCTTPLGTCTLPTGMSVQSSAWVSQSGFPGANSGVGTGAFQANISSTNTGACTMNTNTYKACYNRSDATAGAATENLAINGITAPTSKQTVYVRITLYSDTAFATSTDSGTVAEAFVDQLITTGRVQERLEFCVASIDSAAALPSNVTACAALASTSVDIGVIDNSAVAFAPVTTTATNGSNNKYGILMSNTNASGGISISYYPEAAASGTNQLRSFRVAGSTCNASNANVTDTCFVDAGATEYSIVAGTEAFGFYVACIDNTQGSTTSNSWTVTDDYNGFDDTVASAANCQTESTASAQIAWNTSGSAITLASVGNVVDDEIVKVRYAATASATTPTGSYTVTTNYIATPTF